MRPSPRVRKARARLAYWGRPVAVSSGAVVLVAFGSWAAWAHVVPYVAGHDYFRLRSVRVSSDETRVAPQALAEIAGLYDDSSLWEVDPDETVDKLRDASWVREARVSRRFPWQVSLAVSRRLGVAAAVSEGRTFSVDEEGVLFREVGGPVAPDLPYLTGWDAAPAPAERAARLRALLGVLVEAGRHSVEVSELHMDSDGAVWLYATGSKAAVRLGQPSRAAVGFERLAIALAELGPLADRARQIDTDYPGRIVIRGADDKLPAQLVAERQPAAAGAKPAHPSAAPAHHAPASPGASAPHPVQRAARHG